MGRKILPLAIILFFSGIVNSQNIDVLYAIRNYYSPQTNYSEINTSVSASTLNVFTESDGKYSKSAELVTVVCPVDKYDSAVYVNKRIIKSPKVTDVKDLDNVSLLDLQRIPLQNDNYVVYFEIRDLNSVEQPLDYRDVIQMNYTDDAVNVADIMLVEKYKKSNSSDDLYTKSGYSMQPYLMDLIGKDNNILTYYTEIYNADKTFKPGDYYAVVTCIEDIATNKKVENIQNLRRMKSDSDIVPYLANIDVSSLPQGSYYLTVEVRGDRNILYAYKRFPFTKLSDKKKELQNSYLPKDAFVYNIPDADLDENIRCTRPIASPNEVDFMVKHLKTASVEQKREMLYSIFYSIDELNPENAWVRYMEQVKKVNEAYSTSIKKGYETDMGRVILQYGNPTTVIDEKFGTSSGFETNTEMDRLSNPENIQINANGVHYYPYQIWVYDVTPSGERNRKFIFYARQDNLAEYFLLHSDARGELQDLYWENVLSYGTLERGVVGKAGKQFQRGHK